ncbi:MAG TPA: phospholipase D-like domain-containing protein, partial [Candidatus Obscuribacterales bacterium]
NVLHNCTFFVITTWDRVKQNVLPSKAQTCMTHDLSLKSLQEEAARLNEFIALCNRIKELERALDFELVRQKTRLINRRSEAVRLVESIRAEIKSTQDKLSRCSGIAGTQIIQSNLRDANIRHQSLMKHAEDCLEQLLRFERFQEECEALLRHYYSQFDEMVHSGMDPNTALKRGTELESLIERGAGPESLNERQAKDGHGARNLKRVEVVSNGTLRIESCASSGESVQKNRVEVDSHGNLKTGAGDRLTASSPAFGKLFNENNFYPSFLSDLRSAKESVVIVSAYLTRRRGRGVIKELQKLVLKGVIAVIYTRDSDEHDEYMKSEAKIVSQEALDAGITVVEMKKIHQKAALIDDRIAWEGSLNIMSHNDSFETMRRFENKLVAQELRVNLRLPAVQRTVKSVTLEPPYQTA